MAPTASKTGLGWYLDQIRSTPLLTAPEEIELSRRIREESDPAAREQMIRANLRLVVKIAKEYSSPGMTLGDLVAEGNLGLMRAVEEFDPDAGVRFSTYAAWWIKQAIKRVLMNAGQPVHVPAYLGKLIGKWRRAAVEFEARFGRVPATDEMAAALHITKKRADIVLQGLQAANTPSHLGAEDPQALSEILHDPQAANPAQHLMDEATVAVVKSLLDRLPPRSRRVLELRFGLDGWEGPPRTYKDIGRKIGLTRERVRQLEKAALADLKAVVDELL